MNSDEAAQRAGQLVSKIVTIQSNPHYRMADVFYRRGFRYDDSTQKVLSLNQFDESILSRYLNEVPNVDAPNIQLLSDIARQVTQDRNLMIPADDEIVIHIRAGDVIQHDWFLRTDFARLIRKNRGSAKKCTIVICFAFQEFEERGWWMFTEEKLAGNVARTTELFSDLIFRNPDLIFEVYSNSDIDKDFIYMIESTVFINDDTGSGFGELIRDIRAYRSANI